MVVMALMVGADILIPFFRQSLLKDDRDLRVRSP